MNFAPMKTKRLELRPFERGDLKSLTRLVSDSRAASATANTFFPADAMEIPAWVKDRYADLIAGDGIAFGCWRRAGHELLGMASLSLARDRCDITFWFIADIFGHGYEAEALCWLVGLAFDSLHVAQICAVTHTANVNGISILKESGFRRSCGVPTADFAVTKGHGVQHFQLKRTNVPKRQKGLTPSVIFVGAVALIDHFNRVLVGQRPAGKTMPNLWEFPGGKIRSGEMLSDTAIRETVEELGVDINPNRLSPFSVVSHCYPDFHLVMLLFLCRQWMGECRAIHHRALKWVPARELVALSVPPADVALMRELRDLLTK